MVGESVRDVDVEAVLKLCQKYNVSNMNIGADGSLSICFRDPLPPSFTPQKPDQDPISDEEILMNPYAGMFSNTMPKKG